MQLEEIARQEVRAALGMKPPVPSTAEELVETLDAALRAAQPAETVRMIHAVSGFLAALAGAEYEKKENEDVDGKRS